MTPSIEENYAAETLREKSANYLVGLGFSEIMTNSITNEAYFEEMELRESVKMLNSLSAGLNTMRPSMLESGLEAVAYNLNRKNNDLKFFDFGKTYNKQGSGKYYETEHLCIYVTGNVNEIGWREKHDKADLFYLKGVIVSLVKLLGIQADGFELITHKKLLNALHVRVNGSVMIQLGEVNHYLLNRFDIKQPVLFADINWNALRVQAEHTQIKIEDTPKFPVVYRDLAIIVSTEVKYEQAESVVKKLELGQLRGVKLFDVFESEKLGKGKKSMAINFTFLDKEKTLTDTETDAMMNKIIVAFERELGAEIRK
jgi:phenylalanyl-tRNA synthetase beta chain